MDSIPQRLSYTAPTIEYGNAYSDALVARISAFPLGKTGSGLLLYSVTRKLLLELSFWFLSVLLSAIGCKRPLQRHRIDAVKNVLRGHSVLSRSTFSTTVCLFMMEFKR